MQFKNGAGVYTFDGQNVGHIDRVVLNPNTKEVTHLVVRKGFLFTEDKIVPLHVIESAIEERVALREDAGNLDGLPPFEETHYIPLDKDDLRSSAYPIGTAAALYWYPPRGGSISYPGSSGYARPFPRRTKTETEQNIPEDTVALKEGSRVISTDSQHVGNVVRVFTEPQDNQVTHLLISDGFIFKVKKLIPVSWISEIQEDEIFLGVGVAMLDTLPEYQEIS